MNAIPLEREIEYPTSDGQPMAETLEHQQVMIDLIEGLRSRYAGVPGAWVAGNFFFCYEKGNPNAHVAPDVMVAEGLAPKELRLNYLLWEEKPPSLMIEVTSRSTVALRADRHPGVRALRSLRRIPPAQASGLSAGTGKVSTHPPGGGRHTA